MALWAGIDEAGYGPILGPLVVAGSVFKTPFKPREGMFWSLLDDAVARDFSVADGRLIVDDSKKVYTPSRGIRALEEGVLSFLSLLGEAPSKTSEFLSRLLPPPAHFTDGTPWSEKVGEIQLPLRTNASAVASKSAVLDASLRENGVRFGGFRCVVVLPGEYNSIISHTGNKGHLLWQKSGLLLQRLWQRATDDTFVLIDRHGGRYHYHKLLRDAFPECNLTVQREDQHGSVYQLSATGRTMWVAFKQGGDERAMPTALASMLAKYTREVYMRAFNDYWQTRVEGLKSTAGYAQDAHRFLEDITGILRRDGIEESNLIRGR